MVPNNTIQLQDLCGAKRAYKQGYQTKSSAQLFFSMFLFFFYFFIFRGASQNGYYLLPNLKNLLIYWGRFAEYD